MNFIDSQYSSEGQPFQSPLHLDFLQNASKEAIGNAIKGIIGDSYDPNTWYRLQGAQLTNTGGDSYTNTAGVVFKDGEVYTVLAVGGGGTSMPDGIKLQAVNVPGGSTTMAIGTTRDLNVTRVAAYANDMVGADTAWRPTELRIAYTITSDAGTMDGQTYLFKRNETIIYGGTSTTNVHVTFDFTNAVPGTELVINTPVNTITSFLVTGGTPLLITSTTPITTGMTQLWFRFKYMGKTGGVNYYTQENFGI